MLNAPFMPCQMTGLFFIYFNPYETSTTWEDLAPYSLLSFHLTIRIYPKVFIMRVHPGKGNLNGAYNIRVRSWDFILKEKRIKL